MTLDKGCLEDTSGPSSAGSSLAYVEGFGETERGAKLIARIWRGRGPASKADAYHRYLMESGVEELRRTAGNRGVYVLRTVRQRNADFLTLSLWES